MVEQPSSERQRRLFGSQTRPLQQGRVLLQYVSEVTERQAVAPASAGVPSLSAQPPSSAPSARAAAQPECDALTWPSSRGR